MVAKSASDKRLAQVLAASDLLTAACLYINYVPVSLSLVV